MKNLFHLKAIAAIVKFPLLMLYEAANIIQILVCNLLLEHTFSLLNFYCVARFYFALKSFFFYCDTVST